MSGPGAVTAAGQKNRWGGARVRVPKRESCAANHARAIVSFFRGVRAPLTFPCVLMYPFGDSRHSQPWSSGMMLACHAGDPGSIPGERKLLLIFWMPHRARRSPGYSELQNHVERCWRREMVPE